MAIPESIKKKANQVRNEVYGKDVREALASGIEEAGDIADQTRERQDSVEAQFQSVLDETTGKDVVSAPEITAARVGADDTNHPNLKERLDFEHNQLSSQLAQTSAQKAIFYDTKQSTYPITKPKPFITFVDDDGRTEVITKLKPIFVDRGVPAVCAIIPSQLGQDIGGGRASKEDLLELQNKYGWEMASHTYSNVNLTNLTEEEIEFELRESLYALRSMGFNTNNIVYPHGAHNKKVREIAAKYYRMGVRTIGGGLNSVPITQYQMNRQALGSYTAGGVDREYYKEKIDQCLANNEWLIFMTHIAETPQSGIEDIEFCIDYALSLGIEIGTLNQGFEYFGNKTFIGDYTGNKYEDVFYIETYTGEIFENNKAKSEITVNTNLDEFKTGITTTYFLNADTDAGFPSTSGTLVTFRPNYEVGTLGFGYQLFFPYRGSESSIYFRRPLPNGNWRPFRKLVIQDDLAVKKDTYNGFTRAEEFPLGRVTTFYVTTANNEGFPVGAGMVQVFTPDEFERGYSRQIYYRYASNEIYSRYDKMDGSGWSPWVKIAEDGGL